MNVDTAAWFERIGSNDVQALATDVGPVPMNVGAILSLEVGPDTDTLTVQRLLEQRLSAIPRLRQRLIEVPWGCGRPIWVDDASFDIATHVHRVRCPAPGDRTSLMDTAVAVVTRPLPRSRPLWRAVVITGLADGQIALVVAFHHVLADGIGGLAVLGALVDEAAASSHGGAPPPRPAPTRGQVFMDAAAGRLRALRRVPHGAANLGAAIAELGHNRPDAAPRSSLNLATGPHRQVSVVRADLAGIRDVAHAHNATVNDVMLAAVTGALDALLKHRGESVPDLVISVPVSARTETSTTRLGNQTGVMPVRVPVIQPVQTRLDEIARITSAQKSATRGASAALISPAFRLLAALGVFGWFVERQRLVNSFLTNVKGPSRSLTFGAARITEIVPITITAGNVTIAFAILSYAGTLTVSVIVDPDAVPDAAVLTAALESDLRVLAGNDLDARPPRRPD